MRLFIALIVGLTSLWQSSAEAKSFVYVSVAGENRIAFYELDEATGAMQLRGSETVAGGPGSLTVSPDGKFLFASIRTVGTLASFAIDPADGSLSIISEVPAGADPAYVMIDATGKLLLSAYYQAGKIAVHSVDEAGSISSQPKQEVATDEKAHAILIDRSNKFVFVPHTRPNAIFQFKLDPGAGSLTANDVPKVIRPDNTGPRHLWFHPTLDRAYGSDEQGNSISVYDFDATSGQLAALQTVSTHPLDFKDRNSTADIEVHPSGRFVYVANRGHDSIARFAIDGVSGKVTSLGQTPTEQTPRSFNIDPTGRYLIAAGQSSGKVATYQIDIESGALKRIATTEIGSKPWWVLVVRSDR